MPWIIVCSISVASSCSINLRSTDGPSLPPLSMVGFSTLVTPFTFSARSSRRLLLPVYFCHNYTELASRCSWQLLALSPSCHVHVYVILFAGWSDMLILDTAFGKLAVGHAFDCSSFHALSDGSGLAQVAEHSSPDMYSSTISNPSVEAPPLLLGFGLTAPWYSCHRRCTSSTCLLHNGCWSSCMSVSLISVLKSTKNWRTTVLHNVLLSFLHATQIF